MAKARKTERIVEIHEFYVIRTASGSLPALCQECSTGDAIMLAPEPAAAVAEVPVRTIYRWVETGVIHYKAASNDSIIVCVESLRNACNRITGA